MKKLLYSIALLSCSLPCFAASTTTKQILGKSIQFNCIPELDRIISQVPLIINATTMNLTNACNTLTAAAQAYEDSADASSNLQAQGDFYFNAAQAYLTACDLVLITTENIGAIGNAQDISYIQSYRCNALEAFNQSFESYLSLCLQNSNSSSAASIAANATLSLSYFLINLINLNKKQLDLLAILVQSSPDFQSFMESYQKSSVCQEARWYPVALPDETIANCQWQKFQLPEKPTSYSSFTAKFNNIPSSSLREIFGFAGSYATLGLGTPGQQILDESPTSATYSMQTKQWVNGTTISHNLGYLSNPITGTYITPGQTQSNVFYANGSTSHYIGNVSNPIYDLKTATPSLGSILLPFSKILDPYSPFDPRADSNNPAYDENFANFINIIPQPQYIYTTPSPRTVQNLHDIIRDYMYSADIHKMDSYAYNAYINITAKTTYPEDVLPAMRKMRNERMNVVECYEGAIVKIVTGLTGKTSIAPTVWNYLTGQESTNAITAAECIVIILPMFNAIFKQIKDYDLPFLSALSSIKSNSSNLTSVVSTGNINQDPESIAIAQAAADKAQAEQTSNQQTAMQNTLNPQNPTSTTTSTSQPATYPLQASEISLQAQHYKITATVGATQAAAVLAAAQEAANAAPQDLPTKQALAQVVAANQQAQEAATDAATFVQQAIQASTSGSQQAAATKAFNKMLAVTDALQSAKNASVNVTKLANQVIQAAQDQSQAAQAKAQVAQAANTQSKIQAYIEQHQDASKFKMILESLPDQADKDSWVEDIIQHDTAWTTQWEAQQQTVAPQPILAQAAADKAAADKAAADKAAADKAAADKAAADKAAADKAAADKAAADKAAADKAAADNQRALADKAEADTKIANDKAGATRVHNIIAELYEQYEKNNPDASTI